MSDLKELSAFLDRSNHLPDAQKLMGLLRLVEDLATLADDYNARLATYDRLATVEVSGPLAQALDAIQRIAGQLLFGDKRAADQAMIRALQGEGFMVTPVTSTHPISGVPVGVIYTKKGAIEYAYRPRPIETTPSPRQVLPTRGRQPAFHRL